jgi:effector-binding domain-containing protein
MIAPPEVLHTEAAPTAVIRLDIPRSAMREAFGPAVVELMAALAAQGAAPAGPVFAHHLAMSAERFDFELGVKVSAPPAAAGRMAPGEYPAAKVARTIYSGPYEGLPAAWGEFGAWIRAQGLQPAADLWEFYAVGPQTTADPAAWRTELIRPLKD